MTVHDAFVVYIRATPGGRILNARYEVFDQDSWAIIDAQQMTEPWMTFPEELYTKVNRLLTLAISAALNAPDERQLPLFGEGVPPKLSLLVAEDETERLLPDSF